MKIFFFSVARKYNTFCCFIFCLIEHIKDLTIVSVWWI